MDSQYVTWDVGAALLGVTRGVFYYEVRQGRIIEEKSRKPPDGKYLRSSILARKAEREQGKRRKPYKQRRPQLLYDWIQPGDILATLALDKELYDEDIDFNEPLVYQARQKRNPHIALAAFDQERKRCFGYVSLIPLPEHVILAIMAGARDELSIQLEEVETYDRPGGYTLLCNSAAVSREQPYLLYHLLKRMMETWLERFPAQYITRIYAQAVSETGRLMIAHFFLAPMSGYPNNAYYLDFARSNPSRTISKFMADLQSKAPLPNDLHALYTPPLP